MADITDTQAESLHAAMYHAVNDTMTWVADADVGRWLVGWMKGYGWTVEPPPPPEPRYRDGRIPTALYYLHAAAESLDDANVHAAMEVLTYRRPAVIGDNDE